MLPGIKLLKISCPKRNINDYARNKDEELWVANIDASNPRRITVDEEIESMPSFYPD
jgi:tricorn protease